MHSHTGCICLTFLHCGFSNVFSKRLHKRMHSHTGCICLIFLQCVFSNEPSDGLHERMHTHIGCIGLISFLGHGHPLPLLRKLQYWHCFHPNHDCQDVDPLQPISKWGNAWPEQHCCFWLFQKTNWISLWDGTKKWKWYTSQRKENCHRMAIFQMWLKSSHYMMMRMTRWMREGYIDMTSKSKLEIPTRVTPSLYNQCNAGPGR